MCRRIILPALVLLALNTSSAGNGSQTDSLPPVQKIDHKGILDMVRTGDHRATLVNVWATWCIPCREEMPGIIRLRKQYREKGLNVILVSADDIGNADSTVPNVLRGFGVDFQTYIDNDSTDEEFIGGMNPDWSGALPTSFIYDKGGKLVNMMVGGKSYAAFEKEIRKLFIREH